MGGGAEVLKSLRDKWAGKGLTTRQLVTKLVMSKGHWMPVFINPTTRVKETRTRVKETRRQGERTAWG